jgi:hypothetical protein
MKNLKALIFVVLTTFVVTSYATEPLIGTWKSVTAENGALEGTLVLKKDHTMVLSPKGQDVYKGTWVTSPPNVLALTVPEAGVSKMTYQVSSNKLTLTYDNGNTQEFSRKALKPKKK